MLRDQLLTDGIGGKMTSRKLQTAVQIIGSTGEIFLFLAGFLLGKEAFIAASVLIFIRIIIKLVMSELMYRRQQAVIEEGFDNARVMERFGRGEHPNKPPSGVSVGDGKRGRQMKPQPRRKVNEQ